MNKLWLLGLLVGMAGLQACRPSMELPRLPFSQMSDEEQIALVLAEVEQGFERRRANRVLAHISRHYKDETGLDYEAVSHLLNDRLRQYREIRITRMQPQIRVDGDHAQVIETLGAAAQPADPVATPPFDVQGSIVVYLERHADTWQITGYRSAS